MLINDKLPHTNVILLVPLYLLSYYEEFLRVNIGYNFNDLYQNGRIIITDLKQFSMLPVETLHSSHIFRDEFGATYCDYSNNVIEEAIERLKIIIDSGNYYWTTIDRSQNVAKSIDIRHIDKAEEASRGQYNEEVGTTGVRDSKDENISKAELLSELSKTEEKLGDDIYSYLTSALRCSVQVYNSWKDSLDSSVTLPVIIYNESIVKDMVLTKIRFLLEHKWHLQVGN